MTAINSTQMMEREHADNMELMGNDMSAFSVAKLMGGAVKVDVTQVLTRVGMERLPHYLHGSQKLHQILNADSESAKVEVPQRFPYTYIDLCHEDVLPVWLPQDLVGNRLAGEQDHIFGGSTVDKLQQALEKAGKHRRFFRKVSH